MESPINDVVYYYNQRGAIEKEFDVLKNDFGWKKLPFSELAQNLVYLQITAICRNLYHYIITNFSKKSQESCLHSESKNLSSNLLPSLQNGSIAPDNGS